MSRAEFIEQVAKRGKVSKAEAKRQIDLVLESIEAGLKGKKGSGKFTVGNFGTFTIGKRAARTGRNPRTGEPITIKASKTLRFKAASQLKKAAGI